MKARDLERLIFNPYHTSKIIHYFLSGAKSINPENVIKTELIYLVLPFVYNDKICDKLKNLNKNSKFVSLIENGEFDSFFSCLNHSISCYKKESKTAVIVLSNQIDLRFGKFLELSNEIHYNDESDSYLRKIYKASYNLGIILGKERYLTVFKKLSITEL